MNYIRDIRIFKLTLYVNHFFGGIELEVSRGDRLVWLVLEVYFKNIKDVSL